MQTTVFSHPPRLAPFLGFAALLHAVVILLVPLHRPTASPLAELRLALAQAGAAPATIEQPQRAPSGGAALPRPAAAEGPLPSATPPAPGAAPSSMATATAQVAAGAESARVITQVRAALTRYFVYPMAARRQGWQGEVLVAFLVTRDGRIDHVEVVRSSGFQLLDEAARRSLAQVGTLPGYAGEEPLQIRMPVVYRLEG
jgi:protein TonB